MAAVDFKYVPGNADYAILLSDCRKNSNSIECHKFCIRNTGDLANAFETE
jgi:hypothetical protein